jgi:predicted site-specific integrase-resolvase
MPKQLKAAEAAQYYGTSISNLRKWAREGRINVTETPGGHYVYNVPDIEDPIATHDTCKWCPYVLYSRVSSRKQRQDLERQSQFLKHRYPGYSLIEDIGSGLNNKRPGFRAILEQLFAGNIQKVVVAHPDRFSRFGFDFFEWLFSKFGAVLEAVDRPKAESGEELVDDIMEVFTVFTARYYGSRKYKNRDSDEEGEASPDRASKGSLSDMSSTS